VCHPLDVVRPLPLLLQHLQGYSSRFSSPRPPSRGCGSIPPLGQPCPPRAQIRVQMQIDGGSGASRAYSGPLDAAMKIYQRKGLLGGLYPGIDAAFLRQWTYGACRVGIYAYLFDMTQRSQPAVCPLNGGEAAHRARTTAAWPCPRRSTNAFLGRSGSPAAPRRAQGVPISFPQKLLMGSTAGSIGSFVGTPTELALVRMSSPRLSPRAPDVRFHLAAGLAPRLWARFGTEPRGIRGLHDLLKRQQVC
jgi:hypothetical protein